MSARCAHWIGAEHRHCGTREGVRAYLTGPRRPATPRTHWLGSRSRGPRPADSSPAEANSAEPPTPRRTR